MHFDDILRDLGEFGRYQKRVYFLLCLTGITNGIRMVISAFTQAVPDHRCAIPGYDNDTYKIQSPYHAKLINETIPMVCEDGELRYDKCQLYTKRNYTHGKDLQECNKWVFDKSTFENTVAMQMNMVCKNAMYTSHTNMIFSCGFLLGVFVIGLLSDKFGRKKILYGSIILQLIGGLLLTWAPEIVTYCIIRFINGAATAGVMTAAFVIGFELVGPSKRIWAGTVTLFFFATGVVCLSFLAYLIRDWKKLEIACSAPVACFLFYWWVIPESPRWLLNEFRKQDAEAIVRHAAKVNRVVLPQRLFDDDMEEEETPARIPNFIRVLRSPVLFARTVVVFLNWLVVSMVYYGVSLNTGNFGAGSIFTNFLLSGLVEYPAAILCILLLDRIGRKALHCTSMLLGGSGCTLTIVTILYAGGSGQWTTVMLAMIGKLGATVSFATLYIFTSELFPTVVRHSALGACLAWARGGGLLAPYVVDWGKMVGGNFGRALPLIAFGVCSVAVGLLSLILPETLEKDLPETIKHGERVGRESVRIKRVRGRRFDPSDGVYSTREDIL